MSCRGMEKGGSRSEGLIASTCAGGFFSMENASVSVLVKGAFMMDYSPREMGGWGWGLLNAVGFNVVLGSASWSLPWTPDYPLLVDPGWAHGEALADSGAPGEALVGPGGLTVGQASAGCQGERATVEVLSDVGSSIVLSPGGASAVGLGTYLSDAGGTVGEVQGPLVPLGEPATGGLALMHSYAAPVWR